MNTRSTVANDMRWCTIICSGSAIVTGGARHRIAVLRQLQVVLVLTRPAHFLLQRIFLSFVRDNSTTIQCKHKLKKQELFLLSKLSIRQKNCLSDALRRCTKFSNRPSATV